MRMRTYLTDMMHFRISLGGFGQEYHVTLLAYSSWKLGERVLSTTCCVRIAKYRTVWCGERAGDPSSCVTFHTSFGVKFGTFTCYDLFYGEPGNWESTFPSYVSIGIQQNSLLKHSHQLLAANLHFVHGSASGIYSWKFKVFHKQLQPI